MREVHRESCIGLVRQGRARTGVGRWRVREGARTEVGGGV